MNLLKLPSMKATISLLLLGSGFSFAADFLSDETSVDLSESNDTPYFQIGVGTMWRNIGKTNVNPNFTPGGAFLALPTGVGPVGSPGNRTYDNGFVNIGAATPFSGLTTNFGYPGAAPQVGDNLVFSRGGGLAVGLPTGGSDDADTAPAPYLDFSYVIPLRDDLELGLNVNFAFAGLDGRFGSNVALSSVTTVDTFALGGVIVPTGNYVGPVGGAAPLIPNVPSSRQQNTVQTGTGQFQFSQDTDLYSIAIGPDLRWAPGEKFILGAGAGLVLNFADWSAESRNPALNPGLFQNVATDSGREALFGLYLEANAVYRIDENWGIEGFFRYDWTEDLDASAGATNFTVDLTGLSVGIGVTYRF